MKLHLYLPLVLVGIALTVGPHAGLAHAFLERAEPAVGSQVTARPRQINIWFTEKLEASLCRLQVFSAVKQEVDQRDCRVDPQNPTELEVSLSPILPPGTYEVVWKVVSVDTHMTTGKFTFTVRK